MKSMVEGLAELSGNVAAATDDSSREWLLRWAYRCRDPLAGIARWINQTLRLRGKHGLQAGHLPTFLHGSPKDATVLVGINPGFDEKGNAKENQWKLVSVAQYVRFHVDFFSSIARARGQSSSRWWTRSLTALRFLPDHDAWLRERAHFDKRGRLRQLKAWTEYAASQRVAACDLLPWHSTKDGVTTHLLAAIAREPARSDAVRCARDALLDVACAALLGACGYGAKELVFVSPAAFAIAEGVCRDFVHTTLSSGRRTLRLGRGMFEGTPVIAFDRQILVRGPWKDFGRPEFAAQPIGRANDTGWIAAARRWLDKRPE